jgi:hypothetical protein
MGSPRPLSTDEMGTATLSPTVASFIITRRRLTTRSACFCCAAIASFLFLSISGILKGKYSRHQFDLCPQRLLSESDINSDSSMSLRQANKKESQHVGQGFVKCNCNGPKRCRSKRCACLKNNVLCNSRCPNSVNCLSWLDEATYCYHC